MAQGLEQAVGAGVEHGVVSHLMQRRCGHARQKGGAGAETGFEVHLPRHGAAGDGADLAAHAVATGQFIHDLHADQGGVHVEGNQAPVTAEDRVLMQTEVEGQFRRCRHEVGLQGLGFGQGAAHPHFSAQALRRRRLA